MEHISEILKKQTRTSTSKENTDTWSGADEAPSNSPVCPICKGVRVVHPRLPSGQPDYSRVVPCRCVKSKQDDERQSRLKQYSNLGALARFTFDNLMPEGRSSNPQNQERFTQAFQAAKAFADAPEGWLVFSGPSGSGKTHLAAAIINECIEKGQPAFYITAPDLLDRLRASFNPDSEIPYDEFFEQMKNTPLLALDDLGVQSGTPWAKEKLDQLLTARFNAGLPTVIVTAVHFDEMDDRLRTRLTDARLCHVFILEETSPTSIYAWTPEFELQKNMNFINYKRRTDLSMEQQDNMDGAYRLAFDFAKNPEGWLVFMGETGCGKTHLASAIVNYRYEMGKPALFVVVPDLLDHLRAAFNPESKISYDRLFESVKTAPLLVLDDFGEQSTNPWVKEKLYQLINYRYNSRLPTVITTRLSLDEIMGEVDSSISSRLVDRKVSVTFGIIASDFRTDRKSGQKRMPPRGKTGRNR
ncbi:MAG: DNA replication protein DnaC [Chloroflexi bacterium RBG_13_51_18]|nr:MAG: DNA replication protein DnaC [Chloroflexi bacterium RBG_13_51_18]